MGIHDVSTDALIHKAAEELKKSIAKPAWADYVKTSRNRERAPDSRDWLYVRMGSVLYRLYADGAQGVGSLRSYYGGRQRRGTARPHYRKASGKIIRFCLQALEKEGLAEKAKPKGRKISAKGMSFLEKASKELKAAGQRQVQMQQEKEPEKKEDGQRQEQAASIKHEEKGKQAHAPYIMHEEKHHPAKAEGEKKKAEPAKEEIKEEKEKVEKTKEEKEKEGHEKEKAKHHESLHKEAHEKKQA